MNTKYSGSPELIARVRLNNLDGEDVYAESRITGIQVMQYKQSLAGIVQIDVRDFKKGTNLIVEMELPELMAALSVATLNAEREN